MIWSAVARIFSDLAEVIFINSRRYYDGSEKFARSAEL
jgi:hypothetical protein